MPAPSRAAASRALIAASLICAAALGASSALAEPESEFWSLAGRPDAAATLVSRMSDAELLGQVFMFGYRGAAPDPAYLSWISTRGLGGTKIYGWNAAKLETLKQAIADMQAAAASGPRGIPLFVATDQEGGWVRHLKDGTSMTPGNMAVGASGRPYDAYAQSRYISREIREIGINMNFAPMLDLATEPDSVLIGPRAYSDDPAMTGLYGLAALRGAEAEGIISTAKHYPGHGATKVDSHGRLPLIEIDEDTLWNRELLPFRMLANEGVPAIMSGHIAFPKVTGDSVPATFSSVLLKDYLRERIGFKGVVITDDLLMVGAASSHPRFVDSAVAALKAGNDILLYTAAPSLQDQSWPYLVALMAKDQEFGRAVREAALRVLEVKYEYFPRSKELSAAGPAPAELLEREWSEILDLAFRSATLIRADAIPLKAEDAGRVLLAGPFAAFYEAGKALYPQAERFYFPYLPNADELAAYGPGLRAAAARYDTVVFCLSSFDDLPLLEGLRSYKGRLIVLSTHSPAPLGKAPWVKDAIAVYASGIESLMAGFNAIAGKYAPTGRLPFSMK
jgi:beta-N-acetylhexosaminidase